MALFQRVKPAFLQEPTAGEPTLATGPRSAGEVLRQRREALGLTLDDIAAALKIKPAYLAALEAGRPERLPGPTYAAGFVRAYGGHLGLDSDEILQRFRQESSGLDVKPDLSFPVPLGDRSIPGGGTLLVALILVLCGYGTWYYLSTGQRLRPERVTEVPAALLAPSIMPGPAEQPATAVSESSAPARVAVADSDTAKKSEMTNIEASPMPLPATPAAPAALPNPGPGQAAAAAMPIPLAQSDGSHAYGAADGTGRIVVRATADSWIQVRGTDQLVLFARVLRTGESYTAPDLPGVSMRTGNAGGLQITVDGKPVPPIGPIGAVRNVPLEPQALISGTAVRG
jgi:cytoskeleton protein RodZ